MMVICDDYGRFDARPAIVIGRAFPLKKNHLTEDAVGKGLQKLSAVGLVKLYTCDGKPYLQLTTWAKYQRIRAKNSKYPDPEAGVLADIGGHLLTSDNTCCQMSPNTNANTNANAEANTNALLGNNTRPFRKPTVEDVAAYCKERGNHVDPVHFVDYYEARGWKIGKNAMKDWRAAVRTWERNDKEASYGSAHGNAAQAARKPAGGSPQYGKVL